MSKPFNVTKWLELQAGRPRADIIAEALTITKDTRFAVVQAQRARVTLQTRDVVSKATRIDSRMGFFLTFAQKLDKRPSGVTTADWMLYKDIVGVWVKSGEVDSVILELFVN